MSGKSMRTIGKLGVYLALVLALVSCTSVRKESFVKPVEGHVLGKLVFGKESIQVNIDQISDQLAREQVYQTLEPKVRSFNQQLCTEDWDQYSLSDSAVEGRLLVRINQRSVWDGYYQKNSLSITGQINSVTDEVLLQRTVLVTGKDSILRVRDQHRHVGGLVEQLMEEWLQLAPVEKDL